jgi:hypothetical protein
MLMIKSIANKFRLNYLIEPNYSINVGQISNTNFAEFNQIILVIFGIVLQLITL